jgi:glycosyltransferase involved in cell wall biosynthesis
VPGGIFNGVYREYSSAPAKMKILHVTQGYYPAIGGTEWLVQRVSEELVQRYGDEVTVFTTNCYNGEGFFTPRAPRMPVGWDEINGVKVRRFPVSSRTSRLLRFPQAVAYNLGLPGNQHLRSWASGPIIPGLMKAIEEFPADVIMASSFPLLHMFTALRAARVTQRPCVLHGGLHPLDTWGFQRPMIYQAIQEAPHYIANTAYEAQYVIRRGASPDRVTTIGVGVDILPFEKASKDNAKSRLGLPGKKVIGFIGQLGAAKGVDTLVKAMPIVWSVFPDAYLLIAGARTLFSEQLETMINQLPENYREKVIMRYNFAEEDKPWMFSAVDIFAYPSGYESFGIAFLEAWSCGKPVIGCRRGAIPWVVNAGRDGLLVEFQKEKMLAEAIVLLLENPEWAQRLGETGRQKVMKRYSWPIIARRFREVYQAQVQN